jgi:ACS family tartrate transporter-like MFS transporter
MTDMAIDAKPVVETGADAVSKVLNTLGLFLFIELLLNSIDRVNVSFAALQMNAELGFDPKTYGFGVGLFFLTYMLFQLPMAAALERWGVARPLAIMIVAWGLTSALMGFVHGKTEFYLLRLLLGAAEAGSATATLIFMATWVPQKAAGRFMSRVGMAMPVALLLGAPLSGWLMTRLHGMGGLSGWRWMFFAEGGITVLLGVFAWYWLAPTPAQAKWLSPEQRAWLLDKVAADAARSAKEGAGSHLKTLADVLRSGQVWLFSMSLFTVAMGFYGLSYWLPQLIQSLRTEADIMTISILTMLPAAAHVLGIWVFGWSADKHDERRWHFCAGAVIGSFGLACSTFFSDPWISLALLTLGGFGLGSAHAVFFGIPVGYLRGAPAAAMGFGLINLLSHISGLAGSNAIGWMRERTGSFTSSLYMLAVVLLLGGLAIGVFYRRPVRGS